MLNKFPLIIIDESVDARISEALREDNFDLLCIQEIMPGTSDIEIIKFATEKGGYILTEDKDFGDELVFRKYFHCGAILLRSKGIEIGEKNRLILSALYNHREELLNAFSVLNKNKLRIRKS